MFKTILKNTIVWYVAAVLAVAALAYLLLAPLLIQQIFPQYDGVKKYISVAVCTDLAPGTKSDVFLPINCMDVNKSRSLACIAESVSIYVAPAKASADETLVCPTLVSGLDTTGKKNTALAVHPIEESTLRIIVSATMLASVAAFYSLVWLIVRRIRKKTPSIDVQH